MGHSLTIHPAAAEWRSLASDAFASRDRAIADANRRAMELPTDRIIIMSGHQAQVWHPGILAKWLAASAAASTMDAQPAWIVVDQDDNEPFDVPYPVRLPGDRVQRRTWPPRDGGTAGVEPQAGAPTGLRPAANSGSLPPPAPEPPASLALDSVGAGLNSVRASLVAHADEPSAARQVARAVADLAAPPAPSPILVFATDLSKSPLFADHVAGMRANPKACAEAYNHAVAVSPETGIHMLAADDPRRGPELPLWRLRPASGVLPARREKVHADMLDSTPVAQLAPRALLMTALLRMGLCDLFIHGTGGGGTEDATGYDRVMERWIRGWLGESSRLAPSATVTATLRLPFGVEPVSREDAASAIWLAHHARHDPATLGDMVAGAAKQALLAPIAAARRVGQHPRALFQQLHNLLADYRTRHADRLAAFTSQAAALRARRDDADILADRTWPFPLYPNDQLDSLREAIAAAFSTDP